MKKQVTNQTIMGMKGKEKIAMLTAFDYPSALFGERAGAEIILVGDSLGQTVLGYDTTLPVTMEDMLHHTRSEEHTSELQSHSFISYAVFCLKKKKQNKS